VAENQESHKMGISWSERKLLSISCSRIFTHSRNSWSTTSPVG